MKSRITTFFAHTLLVLLSLGLVSCAARPAPDIKGRWKAVNRYPASTEAILINKSYLFYPSPMDGTLKAMLTRWAKDSKMSLLYQHPYDFTLHSPISKISTSSLQDAVSQLSSIYVEQGVSITATQSQIVVRGIGSATAKDPPHKSVSGTTD